MNPVEVYLDRLHEVRATKRGTPELSYRAALEALLNAVGKGLDPVVQATAELANTGAGQPDFGLMEKKSGNLRGVVEVKSVGEDIRETRRGEQVTRYWKHYGCVLVTNYRDFLLVVKQSDGEVRVEGRFTLAPTATDFWKARPHELAEEHAEGLTDFLRGAMTRSRPVARPAELAEDLARHAREARRRLFRQDVAALDPLKKAMEQALGLHFDDREGMDFFRSSLVQTLFYGLFSGWMLWREGKHKAGEFDWTHASEYLALPLIGDLYEEIARPKRLADLDLREPLEWATTSLNRVAEQEFFSRFDKDHAITLFYEPFLQAFDPELRKELGVWYTPPEIVKYMVGRVDQLLKSELGIDDGLADDNVYVLDPAAGTGSYLIEVARRIHEALTEQGHGQMAANEVKKALCSRVFGFEILAAPYVVAHLQLGILLRSLGTKLGKDERCEVYLTNALTGWEPPKGAKASLSLFPDLQKEAERASKVKRDKPILVILGNPPYNRFAGVSEEEDGDFIRPYKEGLYERFGIRKQLLDDLYVRFFRLAEKRIAEVKGRGIVCYISNYSWLEGLSHPVMREHLVRAFDSIFIDNLHGDRKKSERAPDGTSSETVFSVRGGSTGIQVGTAVATLVKVSAGPRVAQIHYRDFREGRAADRREALLAALSNDELRPYSATRTSEAGRWTVAPDTSGGQATGYAAWPQLVDLFPTHFSGLNENRLNAFITIDRDTIEKRMRLYYDRDRTLAELEEDIPGVAAKMAGYEPEQTRKQALAGSDFDLQRIVPLSYRPFDDWWTYWEGRFKLFNRPRPDFFPQVWPGNLFLSASQTGRKGGFNTPIVADKFGDLHLQDPWSQFFPLFVRVEGEIGGTRVDPNIQPQVLAALCKVQRIPAVDDSLHATPGAAKLAEQVFWHTLAIVWSPAYRRENDASLRQDWPRIPIPTNPAVLTASAKCGQSVGDLLLRDRRVPRVTKGNLRAELKELAVPRTRDGRAPDAADCVITGKAKVTMSSVNSGAAVDIWLNDRVFWSNVPTDVWEMTIGGYPVLKKWLSYREHKVLGRPLKQEEVLYFTEVVRRLKALLLLGDALDANYRAVADGELVALEGSNSSRGA